MDTFSWHSLNWFDYTIIGIVLISVIISFFRGFLREVISLIVWILAIMVALKFATPISEYLKPHMESETLRYLIAFVALFISVLIIGAIFNFIIKLLVSKTGISGTDRMLGIIFGGARGVLAIAIVLLMIQISPLKDEAWSQNSALSPHFGSLVGWLKKYVPEQMNQVTAWISSEMSVTNLHGSATVHAENFEDHSQANPHSNSSPDFDSTNDAAEVDESNFQAEPVVQTN